MSMVDSFVEQLRRRGLSVRYAGEGDKLILMGPEKERTPDLMKALATFRKDLLNKYRPAPEPVKCNKCQAIVYSPGAKQICEMANLCQCPIDPPRDTGSVRTDPNEIPL
jgi:hypothetical protein